MGQDAAKELCKAKTDCNLAWNLVISGEELSLICKAKKQSMGDTITQAPSSLYPAYYTSGSGCSSTSTTKGKPYCTALLRRIKITAVRQPRVLKLIK